MFLCPCDELFVSCKNGRCNDLRCTHPSCQAYFVIYPFCPQPCGTCGVSVLSFCCEPRRKPCSTATCFSCRDGHCRDTRCGHPKCLLWLLYQSKILACRNASCGDSRCCQPACVDATVLRDILSAPPLPLAAPPSAPPLPRAPASATSRCPVEREVARFRANRPVLFTPTPAVAPAPAPVAAPAPCFKSCSDGTCCDHRCGHPGCTAERASTASTAAPVLPLATCPCLVCLCLPRPALSRSNWNLLKQQMWHAFAPPPVTPVALWQAIFPTLASASLHPLVCPWCQSLQHKDCHTANCPVAFTPAPAWAPAPPLVPHDTWLNTELTSLLATSSALTATLHAAWPTQEAWPVSVPPAPAGALLCVLPPALVAACTPLLYAATCSYGFASLKRNSLTHSRALFLALPSRLPSVFCIVMTLLTIFCVCALTPLSRYVLTLPPHVKVTYFPIPSLCVSPLLPVIFSVSRPPPLPPYLLFQPLRAVHNLELFEVAASADRGVAGRGAMAWPPLKKVGGRAAPDRRPLRGLSTVDRAHRAHAGRWLADARHAPVTPWLSLLGLLPPTDPLGRGWRRWARFRSDPGQFFVE